MSGPEFEESLELLIRWQEARYLEERFEDLGTRRIGGAYGEVRAARGHTEERLATTGFVESPETTPRLEPAGMVADLEDKVPVIHLHGAVGWCSEDGIAVIGALWREFEVASDEAGAILVLDHSLPDPPLVAALREVASWKPVAISYFHDNERRRVTCISAVDRDGAHRRLVVWLLSHV